MPLTARFGSISSDSPGVFRLAGLPGWKLPRYDRVDGLSLATGVAVVLSQGKLVVDPSLTYRSRLGIIDPAMALRVGHQDGLRFEGRAARDTRTNDAWITSDLMNSVKALVFGTDARNYFRADIGEGKLVTRLASTRSVVEMSIGGRFERVSPITASGDVYSLFNQSDEERMRRPNPLVEHGHIASAVFGGVYRSFPKDAPITARLVVEAERSFVTPYGMSSFTQVTADGGVEFSTFGQQRLRMRAHAVATRGDSVPRARYVYLGGSRSLGLSELLEYGGTELVFVDSHYLIPIASIQLPIVGVPLLFLVHRIGGAGIGSAGSLRQEVGIGAGLGSIELEMVSSAGGQHTMQVGAGISVPIG